MSSTSSSISRQKEIFLAAREIVDAGERSRFVADACGDDAELRTRIEVMLGVKADGFLEPDETLVNSVAIPGVGEKIGYFGDYVLLDEIAHGSSGVVFRARQVSLDRVVALKMLRDRPLLSTEADTRRLRAEATAAASLDHRNIVPIYEVGAYEGQPYFSMKLIEGGTLQFRTAEFQADPRKAAAFMVKVARAVHHAHTKSILHRDLKPGNILIDAAGEPHITDFGLARKIGLESGLTMTGVVMGTPHYMSPEQARGGGRELTPATDIYSLGAILYELVEGRRIFQSEDLIELLQQVAEKSPPAMRTPHRDLAAIVMKCLEKSPAARYATAGDLADDLERWLQARPVSARRSSVAKRTLMQAVMTTAAVTAFVALVFGTKTFWPGTERLVVTTMEDELDPPGTTGSGLSLREAVRDVPDGGHIVFSQAGKLTLSPALGGIRIARSIEIKGANVEIHNGPDIDRALFIEFGSHVTLQGLTLSGEAADAHLRGSVGAIENNGELTATDCRFLKHGGGGLGGAIVSEGGLTLRRCVFQGNFSNMMGGALNIKCTGAQQVEIEDCLFADNVCYGNGGSAINIGLQSSKAQAHLTRCTVTGNIWDPASKRDAAAEHERLVAPNVLVGGALRIRGNKVTLDRCIVAGNAAKSPGEKDIYGDFTQVGPNFIGGDPKDAPAGLGSSVK
ncbi:protein kinase domain-containing protein [Prosthecobacter sp.]|uniref:protein kinase domain-containing protein n=1 Tax=Prosthecobacter sp. TaxID=1965333 RepID=UPI003782F7EC